MPSLCTGVQLLQRPSNWPKFLSMSRYLFWAGIGLDVRKDRNGMPLNECTNVIPAGSSIMWLCRMILGPEAWTNKARMVSTRQQILESLSEGLHLAKVEQRTSGGIVFNCKNFDLLECNRLAERIA